MLNINFVPDDYIQKRESMRANIMYLVLFLVVMAGLCGVFAMIKYRQRAITAQELIVNTKLQQAKQEIAKLDELELKRKEILKAALTTAGLVEAVPRTVLLAELTNTLPNGVSLRDVRLFEREKQIPAAPKPATYEQAKTVQTAPKPEQITVTNLEIDGIAPSDIQVAGYIAALNSSILLDDVELVLSKEYEKDGLTYRQFRLNAVLKRDIHLTRDDIEHIRATRQAAL